jgi:hypothetical protein
MKILKKQLTNQSVAELNDIGPCRLNITIVIATILVLIIPSIVQKTMAKGIDKSRITSKQLVQLHYTENQELHLRINAELHALNERRRIAYDDFSNRRQIEVNSLASYDHQKRESEYKDINTKHRGEMQKLLNQHIKYKSDMTPGKWTEISTRQGKERQQLLTKQGIESSKLAKRLDIEYQAAYSKVNKKYSKEEEELRKKFDKETSALTAVHAEERSILLERQKKQYVCINKQKVLGNFPTQCSEPIIFSCDKININSPLLISNTNCTQEIDYKLFKKLAILLQDLENDRIDKKEKFNISVYENIDKYASYAELLDGPATMITDMPLGGIKLYFDSSQFVIDQLPKDNITEKIGIDTINLMTEVLQQSAQYVSTKGKSMSTPHLEFIKLANGIGTTWNINKVVKERQTVQATIAYLKEYYQYGGNPKRVAIANNLPPDAPLKDVLDTIAYKEHIDNGGMLRDYNRKDAEYQIKSFITTLPQWRGYYVDNGERLH